tara:strand:+ start:2805 stop:3638 length:834 start_codon:yes stop_codon:yes gene_type:complete
METENDSVSTSETTETVSTPDNAKAEQPRDLSKLTLDDLMKLAEDEAEAANPVWGKAEETPHTVDYNAVLKSLPEEGKQVLANMRADYTRKTQALAEKTRQVEAQQKALMESDAYKKLKDVAQASGETFDPYDPDSFAKKIEQEVAAKILAMYKPMEESFHMEKAKMQTQSFMSEHKEDFSDDSFQSDVKEALLKNENMDLETAFWTVKGKRLSSERGKLSEENTRYKTAMQEAGLKIAGSSNIASGDKEPPKAIKEQGAWAIAQWFENQKRRSMTR